MAQSIVLFVLLVLSASDTPAQMASHKLAFATRAMARGTVLGADDIEYRDSTTRVSNDTNTIAPGWVTRRSISAGEVLHTPAVERPTIVAANQAVELEYAVDNVRLTARGTTMRKGSLGDRVGVRTESGRRMEGTVVAPGRVRID